MEASARAVVEFSEYCKVYGGMDDSRFGKPMPWIGMYVSLASLFPFFAICIDLLHTYRWKKFWVVSKWYALNAATLTVVGVTVKIPSDITGSMPGLCEQLTKISGVVLVCITMGHAVSFHGILDDDTMFSNLIALGILVVTLFVNVWIQIHTGVVTEFVAWYKACSILMLYLFGLTVRHNLSLSKAMKPLVNKYNRKHKAIAEETGPNYCRTGFPTSKLREYIDRYWLMAVSTNSSDNPLFINNPIICALTCGALGVAFMIEALKAGVVDSIREGCCWDSDFKWSVGLVLLFQLLTICSGTVVCLLRLACIDLDHNNYEPSVNPYAFRYLMDLLRSPLPRSRMYGRIVGFVFYATAMLIVFTLLVLECLLYTLSTLQFVAFTFVFGLVKECIRGFPSNAEKPEQSNFLSDYVLTGRSYPRYTRRAIKGLRMPRKWIQQGQGSKPTDVFNFLKENSVPTLGFPGIVYLSYGTGDDATKELQNNWTSTLISLAIIIRATLPHHAELLSILKIVDKGIKYSMFLDNKLGSEETQILTSAVKAGWDAFYYSNYSRLYQINFNKLVVMNDCKKVIEQIRKQAKDLVGEHIKDFGGESPLEWPANLISFSCLDNVISSVFTNIDLPDGVPPDRNAAPYLHLRKTLSDVMAASLLNLPNAILQHCASSKFGARERNVREAAILLGEVEEIIEWLQEQTHLDRCPGSPMEFLNNWIVEFKRKHLSNIL